MFRVAARAHRGEYKAKVLKEPGLFNALNFCSRKRVGKEAEREERKRGAIFKRAVPAAVKSVRPLTLLRRRSHARVTLECPHKDSRYTKILLHVIAKAIIYCARSGQSLLS